MVVEELKHWPAKKRAGPMVIGTDGLPFAPMTFRDGFNADRSAAGLPKTVWARDLRASGITEARAGGVSLDDAAKVAGHAGTRTTAMVYDRAVLEAAQRFAAARQMVRNMI